MELMITDLIKEVIDKRQIDIMQASSEKLGFGADISPKAFKKAALDADYHSKFGFDCGFETLTLLNTKSIPAVSHAKCDKQGYSLYDLIREGNFVDVGRIVQSLTIKVVIMNEIISVLAEEWNVDPEQHFKIKSVLD